MDRYTPPFLGILRRRTEGDHYRQRRHPAQLGGRFEKTHRRDGQPSGTLQAWMTVENIDLKTIGFFSLVGQAYVFKFLT
jgi:hypothetical protein